MWKYLIVNGLWFSLLFLVHFFGSHKDQWLIFLSILLAAGILAAKGMIDPVAWVYYLAFSCLVFYGSARFRHWSFAELARLKDELRQSSTRLTVEKERLRQRSTQTHFLEQKADEIVEFYEQIKEMSKSLDDLETFLIFAEALSEYFTFNTVKLSIFGPGHSGIPRPTEVYELKGSDFQGVFDRSAYLKDKKKAIGDVFPFDQSVYKTVFEKHQGVIEPDHIAAPVFIHDRIFAIISVTTIETQKDPLLPILVDRFVSEMQRVKLYEGIETLAITDGLTGIYVRRHLMERLEGEMDRSKRFNLKLSFLMIDVDHFKEFNDGYGHLVGDVVLRHVAQTLKSSIREVDFVGRYGGEEFAIGLIETDETTAQQVAERIRRTVESREFKAYGERLKVTVSVGCATLRPGLGSVHQIVDAADQALYQAKRLGRNRVCVANG